MQVRSLSPSSSLKRRGTPLTTFCALNRRSLPLEIRATSNPSRNRLMPIVDIAPSPMQISTSRLLRCIGRIWQEISECFLAISWRTCCLCVQRVSLTNPCVAHPILFRSACRCSCSPGWSDSARTLSKVYLQEKRLERTQPRQRRRRAERCRVSKGRRGKGILPPRRLLLLPLNIDMQGFLDGLLVFYI